MTPAETTIVVCGGGLAGHLAAVRLSQSLGAEFRIVQITGSTPPAADFFYGGATAPMSHNFLHETGLDERTLLLESQTAFSFGCTLQRWGSPESWMLCHHAPLPAPSGIPLRHFLTRSGAPLSSLLMSAQAAALGRFAHPPDDPRHPLSRAEYGYQFAMDEWVGLLDTIAVNRPFRRIPADIVGVETTGDSISAVRAANGERVPGDIFIDATGLARRCIGALAPVFRTERKIAAFVERKAASDLGPPCRVIDARPNGWTATIHLQAGALKIGVRAAEDDELPASATPITLGRLDEAWIGNCIALGHAAWAIEPLTPAPMMMLQRDIERLLDLVPVCADMSVERREFNRRYAEDVTLTRLFHDALYWTDKHPDTPYWHDAVAAANSDALARKISQFQNRGGLVNYDLEPFNDEDWTQNHLGMGRTPRQYDRQLDGLPARQAEETLVRLKTAVGQTASKMPPHHIYVARYKAYLQKQSHV